MSHHITVNQVKATLDIVAYRDRYQADAPVGRHLPTRFVEDDKPCCLVAVILHELGFTIPQLRQLDAETGNDGGIMLGQSRHPLLRRINPDALELLAYVQKRQDMDETWVQVADRAMQRGQYATNYQGRERGWQYDKAARAWTNDVFPWNRPSSEHTP